MKPFTNYKSVCDMKTKPSSGLAAFAATVRNSIRLAGSWEMLHTTLNILSR